ncbi:uncharacterized protein FFB20_11930 [Fusarium fujikuroi]|uniref:Uncharacterized protein n=1 Tax=Fusarium fujikuroi TaxID=5127 RepID=A0A2H3STD2_FUSFU|nr:uncharacterized protein FFB20_11930 [Fusarium fujikuroi]SCO23787.1 uncharacterized protein FFE2_15757 [Fusarium fujikuroi]SCO26109.1 uncharacterized protein FFC1_15859 [Fusarium fujikuroi]SCO26720.1 uncharacterized protein FFM5_14989 [Fusarium fujikuroi]SCO53720.1 uncharacterized protein FFNC_15147 [Fusarium fujikuroi]
MVWTNTKPDPADAESFRPQGANGFQISVLGTQWDGITSLAIRIGHSQNGRITYGSSQSLQSPKKHRDPRSTSRRSRTRPGRWPGSFYPKLRRDQGYVYLETRSLTSIIKGQGVQSDKICLSATWGLNGISKFSYKASDSSNFIQFPVDKGYQMQWRDYRGDRLGVFTFNNDAEAGYIDCESFTYDWDRGV